MPAPDDTPTPTTVLDLPDGRRAALDDVGDPGGVPVLYLHGSPDCRLARHPDDSVAAGLGVRLLALDRPGWGASDALASPSLAALGADVGHVLDALGVERAAVLAWSAGSVQGLAAAAVLGPRIVALTTFGAVPPLDGLRSPAVWEASALRRGFADAIAEGSAKAGDVATFADQAAAVLVPPPPVPLELAREHVLEQLGRQSRVEVEGVPGALDALAGSVRVVAATGPRGLGTDLALQFAVEGDVDLAATTADVLAVHGGRDALAPPPVGRWLAEVTGGRTEVWPDAGHHALLPRWADLLAPLAAALR